MIAWFAMAIFIFTISFIRGKRALSIFPDLSAVNVLFRESGASGFSDRSFISSMAKSRGILEIIITENELWVRSNILLAGTGKMVDMVHKIEFAKIKEIGSFGNETTIVFTANDQINTTIRLQLKKEKQFLETITPLMKRTDQ